ncbi:Fic/DOC family protein [Rhodococcus sp. IEGM 1408]|uniref:Fic/DOC family protein n=1 Tax=Rhodococcus sp. IEGM 1408 TaxID=3082220 RepID=UPI0029552706|nr:Fic family protein [Rhodococcus sp. IEGM 1408]MDV8002195.1 Fic family protein [Rhodococcus sp. IEGM 1408]
MNPRDPYTDPSGALRNRLGITDPHILAEHERDLAFFRVVELERTPIEGRFDFAHLRAIHRHILQDVYDWAGELRTTDTGAFGIPHARPQFLREELDRVFHQIATRPPSTTDSDAATDTIAAHWSELTLVHPFRDGNSRSQRVFFDQMFRHAGWAVNWAGVDAAAAHAARHMSLYGRPDYLADQLRHAVYPIAELADGGLSATQGIRSAHDAGEHFRAMREHHAAGIVTPYVP